MSALDMLRSEYAALVALHKGKKRANQPGYVRVRNKAGRWTWVPEAEAKPAPATTPARAAELPHADAWDAFERATVEVASENKQPVDRVRRAFADAKAAARRGDPAPIDIETAKRMMHASSDFLNHVGMRVRSHNMKATDDDDFLNRVVYAAWQAHAPIGEEHGAAHWTTADPETDMLGDVRWTDERYTDKDGERWRKVMVHGNPHPQRDRWNANGKWKLEHPQELDKFRQGQEDFRRKRGEEAEQAEKTLQHISLSELREQRGDIAHALAGKHPISTARDMVNQRIAMLELEEHTQALEREAKPHVQDLQSRVGDANAVVMRDPSHGFVRSVHGGAGARLEARSAGKRAALHVDGREVLRHEKLEPWQVQARQKAAARGERVGPEHHYEFVKTDIPAAVLERVQEHPDRVRKVEHKGQTFYAASRFGGSEWTVFRADGRKVGGKLHETLVSRLGSTGRAA